jgi:hypothetical protein
MPKHRGPILEHINGDTCNPSNLTPGDPGDAERERAGRQSAGASVPGTPRMHERTWLASGGKKHITCFIY